MTLAVIWLVALAIVLAGSALLAAHCVLSRVWTGAIWGASALTVAIYCLLAVDAAERIAAENSGMALLWKFCLVMLVAGVIAVHLYVLWRVRGENRAPRRIAGVSFLVFLQVAVVGSVGFRFQEALAATATRTFSGGLELEEIPGQGLITDRGRFIPVYRVVDPLSLRSAEAWQRPVRPASELLAETIQSNCHGWVFTRGRYIVERNGVEMILADNGYQVVTSPRVGDVVVYRDASDQIVHTGLVRTADAGQIWIESKFGVKGRYIHRPEEISYLGSCAYYRTDRDPEWLQLRSPHLVNVFIKSPGLVMEDEVYGGDGEDLREWPQMIDLENCPDWVTEDLSMGAE